MFLAGLTAIEATSAVGEFAAASVADTSLVPWATLWLRLAVQMRSVHLVRMGMVLVVFGGVVIQV